MLVDKRVYVGLEPECKGLGENFKIGVKKGYGPPIPQNPPVDSLLGDQGDDTPPLFLGKETGIY